MAALYLGALLRRTTSFGVGWHYGIVVQAEPKVRVVENQMFYGVREISLDEFADGRPYDVRPTSTTKFAAVEIVARARSRIGEKYALEGFNCEDLVNWVLYGEARSIQTAAVDLLLLAFPATQDFALWRYRMREKRKKMG